MKQNNGIRVIHDGICHLGECPVWNAGLQKLFWTDIYNRRIWEYNPSGGCGSLFWEGNMKVGGFAFTKKNDIVACTDSGVYLIAQSGLLSPMPLFTMPFRKNEMFNDITADPRGRVFAGTLDRDGGCGVLYRLEKEKTPVIVLDKLKCSNGMAFSLDRKYFYHTDSLRFTITRYSYGPENGSIANPAVFYRGDETKGFPDGLTIDSEGNLWSAFWGGGTVKCFNPAGEMIKEIQFPAKQISSIAFGGRDLKELFVTSSCQGGADLTAGTDKDGVYLGGKTYAVSVEVAGVEDFFADF